MQKKSFKADGMVLGAWVVVFSLAFWPTFVWMAERFDAQDSFYSHGWLIPLASAWLIWRERSRLNRPAWQGSYHGLFVLLPALLLHGVATGLHLGVVSGFALLAALVGLVWMVWGMKAVRQLRFPLAFLIFMIPLPGVLLIAASFNMKLLAANLATQLMQLIGIQAVQAGSTIQLPGVSVVVDDTCSGLRSLISLLALAVFWTRLLPPSSAGWKKGMLVAAAVPVALIANIIRIVLLSLIALIYGTAAAESFLHYGSGIVLFMAAAAVLAWLSRCLTRQPQAGALS